MNILTIFTFISNIFAILVLLFGLFYQFNNPKSKAAYGYWLFGSMVIYMLFLSLYIVYSAAFKHDFYSLMYVLCLVSPFIIGHFVKYETLKRYTILQILFFSVSLFAIL